MNDATPVLATGLAILILSLFLDLLELSFGRIVWFIRTLRFWLYFILHFGMSCLAASLLYTLIQEWYLLAVAATFLGVGVLSNVNVKVAGYSLIPIAQLFETIKAKMFEQAAEEKLREVLRAQLIERLQRLSVQKIEEIHSAGLMGKGQSAETVQEKTRNAAERAGGKGDSYKKLLIGQLIRANIDYVHANIDAWENTD